MWFSNFGTGTGFFYLASEDYARTLSLSIYAMNAEESYLSNSASYMPVAIIFFICSLSWIFHDVKKLTSPLVRYSNLSRSEIGAPKTAWTSFYNSELSIKQYK